MKILDREVQLMSDEERKNSHQCFICGDTSNSVKYTIDIGKYTIHLCNKCAAIYCGNRDFEDVFKAAMQSSDSYFDGDKYIKKSDVENEYTIIKEMNRDLNKPNHNMIDEAIKNILDKQEKTKNKTEKYGKKIVDMNNPDHFDKLSNIAYERIMRFLKDNGIYGASTKPIDKVRIEFGKVPYAVRIYTTNNNQDIAQFKYVGGISFIHNLTVDGYDCFKDVNGYTLFYDERIDIDDRVAHINIVKAINLKDYVLIDYGESSTPIATIIAGFHSTDKFKFNDVADFNEYFIKGLLTDRRKETNKPIYFIDQRNKTSFDDLNM